MDRREQLTATLRRRAWGSDEEGDAPLIGLFWAGIWLFWLISPLWDALRNLDRPGGWVGVVAVLAFAAVYLRHWMMRWQLFGSSTVRELPTRDPRSLARYGVLAALSLIAMVAVGQSAAATLVFVGVSAMWTFSIRAAVVTSIAIGVGYAWASVQIPGWKFDSGSLIGLTFATVACFAGRIAGGRANQLEASRRENSRLAVDEERNRMARDLHDILGHSLTVITVKAELAGKLIDVDPERARAEVADLERLSRDALADVRRTVTGFREVTLSGELARAREALRAAGIRADLPTATDGVPSDLREVFAWTVREGVTNVIRHSGARSCTIEVGDRAVTVRDDGVGTAAAGCSGHGIIGLRERALAAGTRLVTESVQPHGFALTMAAPDDAASDRLPEKASTA
ncbi:sensor histidine kinase [Allobranchiibius huperziae]|uniref:Two-component system sensor histidine kinase DesK n=1 Tax=Allobranchiibius huperziae TaxID=1874116 RepID=A0A853DBE9_9MICO|nr:two-component system sensor histidine kinase DesK [Allobranchiibius huperziae]